MPHDRRTSRVLMAMTGLVGVAMSVGCMRSTNLRSSAGPLPDLSPAGELHPVPGAATSGASPPMPATGPGSPDRGSIAIAAPPCPSVNTAPSPGGPAANAAQGMAAVGVAPRTTSDPAAPTGAATSTARVGTGAADESPPVGRPSPSPAPTGEGPGPGHSTTPLLDAEIRRAQAVTRQHFESLDAAETPAPAVPVAEALPPAVDPAETPPARPASGPIATPRTPDPDSDLIAPLPSLSAPQRNEAEAEAESEPAKIVLPALMPVDPPGAGPEPPMPVPPPLQDPTGSRESSPEPSTGLAAAVTTPAPPAEAKSVEMGRVPTADAQGTGEVRSTSVGPSARDDRQARPPLEIASLRLCSKVKKFGQVETMDAGALKAGQRLLVYWEMSGLEYQARGDAFVSRLAARLELRAGADGPVVWEHAPRVAEDVCPSPRQDYYASYPVELPGTLDPGPYRLRLIQTDLVGNRATSREVPVTVVR